jgi:hypothetical protein
MRIGYPRPRDSLLAKGAIADGPRDDVDPRFVCNSASPSAAGWTPQTAAAGELRALISHQCPVLGIDFHGSWGGNAAPFCRSSTDCLSGERTNAIMPSRGGRFMVTPAFIRRSQVA